MQVIAFVSMQVIAVVAFIALGLVQFAATWAGLTGWLGLHWLLAIPVAMIIAYIPLLGSIFGVLGAVNVWDWEWWQAVLLFFGWAAFVLIASILAGVGSAVLNPRR